MCTHCTQYHAHVSIGIRYSCVQKACFCFPLCASCADKQRLGESDRSYGNVLTSSVRSWPDRSESLTEDL